MEDEVNECTLSIEESGTPHYLGPVEVGEPSELEFENPGGGESEKDDGPEGLQKKSAENHEANENVAEVAGIEAENGKLKKDDASDEDHQQPMKETMPDMERLEENKHVDERPVAKGYQKQTPAEELLDLKQTPADSTQQDSEIEKPDHGGNRNPQTIEVSGTEESKDTEGFTDPTPIVGTPQEDGGAEKHGGNGTEKPNDDDRVTDPNSVLSESVQQDGRARDNGTEKFTEVEELAKSKPTAANTPNHGDSKVIVGSADLKSSLPDAGLQDDKTEKDGGNGTEKSKDVEAGTQPNIPLGMPTHDGEKHGSEDVKGLPDPKPILSDSFLRNGGARGNGTEKPTVVEGLADPKRTVTNTPDQNEHGGSKDVVASAGSKPTLPDAGHQDDEAEKNGAEQPIDVADPQPTIPPEHLPDSGAEKHGSDDIKEVASKPEQSQLVCEMENPANFTEVSTDKSSKPEQAQISDTKKASKTVDPLPSELPAQLKDARSVEDKDPTPEPNIQDIEEVEGMRRRRPESGVDTLTELSEPQPIPLEAPEIHHPARSKCYVLLAGLILILLLAGLILILLALTGMVVYRGLNSHDSSELFLLSKTWINEQQKLWEGSEGLTILVVGRAGTGKSTLINGLFSVEEEQKKPTSFNQNKPPFVAKKHVINKVPLSLMFWNSPKENSNEVEKVKDVDLIVYTLKMSDPRFQPEDKKIMRILVEIFGTGFFNKTVFALTFANKVGFVDTHGKHQRNKETIETKKIEWKNMIMATLKELSDAELGSIPVVTVGHHSEPVLFDKLWLTEMLKAFLLQLKEGKHPALVKICEQHFNKLLYIADN